MVEKPRPPHPLFPFVLFGNGMFFTCYARKLDRSKVALLGSFLCQPLSSCFSLCLYILKYIYVTNHSLDEH